MNQPMIIGVIGKMESGKDTFCRITRALGGPRIRRIAFGDALKAELGFLLGLDLEEIEYRKREFRAALQALGKKRRTEDPEYWIKRLPHYVPNLINLVTDVRFLNEAEHVKASGGILVRVIRQDGPVSTDISETELEQIQPDHTILNNGRLEEYRNRVLELSVRLIEELVSR